MSSSAGETEAALLALLHLIRLMGAELVAGQHRDDVEVLVKAVETKLRSARFPAEMPNQDIVKGLDLAEARLRPILEELRARSEKAHLSDQLLLAPRPSRIH
ncbi:hypothetical protein ACE103_14500 [Bradyrhizobium sp. ma5]|jgi:hypothetical protein|uniref:hypothetical protein n=1 Tax=unclassified Bradyrhizobium TaxID=2631580 RepID=UPI001CC523FB|nr:hypothetical protein [Bradyrhizobium sp. RD5-C2]GIQ73787.1 hypothetical protein BraRD5C2_22250 [Bradyrhizobium sp. RD5-C2]